LKVTIAQSTMAPCRSEVVACVFVTAVPITKLFAWGVGHWGGHVLRESTSRGLCGLDCPSLVNAGEWDIVACCIPWAPDCAKERERLCVCVSNGNEREQAHSCVQISLSWARACS
jgi:hypothetical protein